MLQYPINFYPDGHTVDPSGAQAQKTISFTFKGDILRSAHYRVYDYDTEEVVAGNFIEYSNPERYNNETINNSELIDLTYFPINGEHRYVLQCLLTQGESNMLLCDSFVLRGELVDGYDISDDGVNIRIEDKINLIYEWNVNSQGIHTPVIENVSGVDKTFGIIKMQLGSERRTILSYNYNTGEVILDSAFNHDYPAGTPYQLYSNYLITQQYFFKTIPTPSFTNLSAVWASSSTPYNTGVHFSADYLVNEYNALKYYTVTLEKQDGDDIDGQPRHYVKIYETDKIYSQQIKQTFYDDYDVYNEDAGLPVGNSNTRRYLFTVNGVLQNGMKISAQLESQAPERVDTDVIYRPTAQQINTNEYHNAVKLTWGYSAGDFGDYGAIRIYRYDMNEKDVIHKRVMLASVYADDTYFIDTTVSNNKTYRYVLVPFWRVGGGQSGGQGGESLNPIITNEITTTLYGYTITELVYDKDRTYNGKSGYRIGESWHLRAEIEDSTITQNTDKVLHVGYGKYSSATHTGLNYMSSTFSGSIVQVDCEGEKKWRDDIELVNAWRDFITRDCIYLLRSQKGDVWVINVVDNPTTTYDEKTTAIPTSVSFNWAECASINDIMIVVGQGW